MAWYCVHMSSWRMLSARNHLFQGSEPFWSHFVWCELVRTGTKCTIFTRWTKKANTPWTQSKGKRSNWKVTGQNQVKSMVHYMSSYTTCLLADLWMQTFKHGAGIQTRGNSAKRTRHNKMQKSRVCQWWMYKWRTEFRYWSREDLCKTKRKIWGTYTKDFRDPLRGISLRGFPWNWFCLFW